MQDLYFKQPHLTAEKACKMMEKQLLAQGEKVTKISPFKLRISTGSLLWKGDLDIEFSKKEDHLVISLNKRLFSGALKSWVAIMRSGKIAQKIESIARYLFEEPVAPEQNK